MIIGCLSVYQGAQWVGTLLTPLQEYLDRLIVIDGVFRPYLANGYFNKAYSTDGTREIIEDLNLKCPWSWIPSPPTGWESHAEKCAEFLKYIKPGDWQYYLNDDEILAGDIPGLLEEIRAEKTASKIEVPFCEVYVFHKDTPDQITIDRVTTAARFFRCKERLLYGYTHADLVDEKNLNFRQWKTRLIKGAYIIHLKQLRPPVLRDRTDETWNRFTDVHVRGTKKTLISFLAV